MSITYPTEFDIAVFSRNKLCSFYVLRNTDTDKFHVFLVVFPENDFKDRKGYIVSSHDNEELALRRKDKFLKMLKNENISSSRCNGTGWYRDNALN